jgi:SAM-dependent methyltransferase
LTPVSKQFFLNVLRQARLLPVAEQARFLAVAMRSWRRNRGFALGMDNFVPPPAWILYDASGGIDYRAYYNSGKASAGAIARLALPYLKPDCAARILEWGCGPARIVQHIPGAFAAVKPAVYATDYNGRTISWCRNAIQSVSFEMHGLSPPLPFEDASFDLVYCVSVFTHLSENAHYEWLKELRRVVAPGGVVMMTVHGDKFQRNLFPAEKSAYRNGQLVVRGAVKEGSRIYSSYHSPAFMQNFLGASNIVLHEPHPDPSISGGQDVWITR